MKKVVVKCLSVILVVILTLTTAPLSGFVGLKLPKWLDFSVSANAEDVTEQTSSVESSNKETEKEEYIYYSGLFYGYPHYLANDPFFQKYSNDLNNVNSTVYDAYKNSGLVVGTGLENALDVITSPTEMTKLITDALGLTDFSYNDALDAANEEFVKNILSESTVHEYGTAYGKTATFTKNLNVLVSVFNAFAKESPSGDIVYNAEYYVQKAFDYLHNEGKFSFISDDIMYKLWLEINDKGFALKDCFKLAVTELEIAQAIMTALMMEDMRIEIVDSIIATQTTDTILKQGMARLKKDLQDGFIMYFINNYLVNKVIDEVHTVVDKMVVDMIMGKQVAALFKVAKLAFSLISDVPSLEQVLKWRVLMSYSNDLANTIPVLAESFGKEAFLSDEILKYEDLFTAYEAVNKSAIAATKGIAKMLDPFGEAYAVLTEAVNNEIETVTIKTGTYTIEIPSTTTDEELYTILILDNYVSANGLVPLGKSVTVSNGISTVKIKRKANQYSSIVQGCINESWEEIIAFDTSYGNVGLYGKHINSVKEIISNTPIDEKREMLDAMCSSKTYKIDSDIKLLNESDEITDNALYCVGGFILGDMYIIQNKKISVNVKGNITIYTTGKIDFVIPEGSSVLVDGNINFLRSPSGGVQGYLIVYGELTITGSILSLDNGTHFILNYNKLMVHGDIDVKDVKSNYLEIRGNLNVEKSNIDKIVFNGTEIQSVKISKASIINIMNIHGIAFESALKSEILFNHNGNPFILYNNGKGSTFVDYDGDGMLDNVDPKPTVGNSCTITVKTEKAEKGAVSQNLDTIGGTKVTVTAEPTFKYDFDCWKDSNGNIVSNNAKYTFVAKGDTVLTAYFIKRQRNIMSNTENGTLSAPTSAEIDSIVTLNPIGNEGYVFTENSITVNGVAIIGNSFAMPDEDVILEAEFARNEYYFVLKEVITESLSLDQSLYSKVSVSALNIAINNAKSSLVNNITKEESDLRIAEIETAKNNLTPVNGVCGDNLTWSYDEEKKTLTISGAGAMCDYTDSDAPWKSFDGEITTVVIGREISSIGNNSFNTCEKLTDVYYEGGEADWNEITIGTNNTYLTSATLHPYSNCYIIFIDGDMHVEGLIYKFNSFVEFNDRVNLDDVYIKVYDANGVKLTDNDLIGTSATIYIYDIATNELISTYTVVLYGDVNGDGLINKVDQEIITNVAICQATIENKWFLMAADTNHDGAIDGFDVIETELQVLDMHNIEQVNNSAYIPKKEEEVETQLVA